MASLRIAFAATCALLLAASASSSPPPAVPRDVGGETGRTLIVPPSAAGNGTEETLSQWAEAQHFHVGDVLDFKNWNGSVLLLDGRGAYDRCGGTAASPAVQFPGGGAAGVADTQVELDRPTTFYFASGVPGRCEAGQRMAVPVLAAVEPPPPFFAPTSDVAPDDEGVVPFSGTTAPPPPPPPPAVVFKLTASAWLWIATVGIFALILLCVIFFCLNEQAKLARVFLGLLAARNKALSSELAAGAGV